MTGCVSWIAAVPRAARAIAVALACLATPVRPALAQLPPPRVVDAFESSGEWTALPASGVEMKLSVEPGVRGNSLRVDFHFTKGGGYAVLHRKLALDLPQNFRFKYHLKGATGPQNLEFKLLDESGENVWWLNRPDFRYPSTWTEDRIRKRQISFAWGPRGGGDLARVAALEFAITAGSGGKGTVWFDELVLEALPPPGTPAPPVASASSAATGHAASHAADSLAETWWESGRSDRAAALTLDLGGSREFGGLVLDWRPGRHATRYAVEFDDGDGRWRTAREVVGSDGGRDWLEIPESEARRVRVRAESRAGASVALADVHVMPLEWSSSPERFLMAVAQGSPRGHYPRGLLGEQSYWTVVGVDGAGEEALFDEDARVEVGRAQFSLEPFLVTEQGLRTWAHDSSVQPHEPRGRPIPTAQRRLPWLELRVTAFALGSRENSRLFVRYRLRNAAPEHRRATLVLALRPYQVNPPSQFLNVPGGPARIASIQRAGAMVRVNDERTLAFVPAPDSFGVLAFDEGDLVARLAAGSVPRRDSLRDPVARASGVAWWSFELEPREEREVVAVVPLRVGGGSPEEKMLAGRRLPARLSHSLAVDEVARLQADVERDWDTRLGSFRLEAPGSGQEVALTARAQLGYVLVNRDGAGIQPGSRSYERSWIRDGSLTSSAMLRSGMVEPVREYLEWYARFQYADGKVPCCVDRRGSDPVPEHDSHGEFVFLAAEYVRLTGDTATVAKLWSHVRGAVAYQDTLRAQRRTAEWRRPANAHFFGLLPPSISHEGYSAKPMHSYWDDLFALRGYKDGVWLAETLGRREDARWMRASRDQFAADFKAAVIAAQKVHGIDFVPGCSDLGDFDATSTTIALSPVQADGVLPAAAVERTFERYWENFVKRRDGHEKWDAYTPYELRNVGAFVRLGWRDRAHELLRWFMEHRRPAGWRQWAEVVDREPRHARFLGDMPHTWVGTDFVRSVQEMLAYERERDGALVIGAGIPADWLEGDGVRVEGLHTRWGVVSYALRREAGKLRLTLDTSKLRTPAGGIEFAPPQDPAATRLAGTVPAVSVGGRLVRLSGADERYHWRPTAASRLVPRELEWGHAQPRAVGSPARRRVLSP